MFYQLKNAWYWLVRHLLAAFVRPQLLPQNVDDLGLDSSKPVVYALDEKSMVNMLVLESLLRKAGLPSASANVVVGGLQPLRANTHIRHLGGVFANQTVHEASSNLKQLCDYLSHNSGEDVQLVPVSLIWGRRPDKEESIFKLLFSASWSIPGSWRKAFMVLVHGRDSFVQLSKPLSLQQLVSSVDTVELAQRKVARVLRVHFRRQQEASIGPDLSHRRTLLNNLMARERVQQAIAEHVSSENVSAEQAKAKAHKYAEEIAAHYSHAVIRILEIILGWVWNRLYRGVRLSNMQGLSDIAKDHEVIYVPSHRSHIDYLLLSYVLYRNGLVPPHIAAGVNLNMPVIGPVLRRGGAFFMRRSFKGNPLYATVFAEYFYMTMEKGYSIEYFVEGGRSRTGRLLSPRAGMLAMTVKGLMQGCKKPVALVPVYLGYERIVESGSYVSELHGKKKKKESLGGFLFSLKQLMQSFGQVHVNFGDAIILEDFLDQQEPAWREHEWPENNREPWFKSAVDKLAVEVVQGINAAAVLNPINLLAVNLLSTRRHALERETLIESLSFSVDLADRLSQKSLLTIAERDPEKVLNYGMQMGVIDLRSNELGDVVVTDEANAVLLTYFRNNVIHLFALPSLMAAIVLNSKKITRQHLNEMLMTIYPYLQAELFLNCSEQEAAAQAENMLQFLLERGLIEEHAEGDEQFIVPVNMQSPQYGMLSVLARVLRHSFMRYYIVVRALVSVGSGKLSAVALEKQSVLVAKRLALLFEFNSPEFSDAKLFRTFIDGLLAQGQVSIDDDRKICFNEALSKQEERAHRILPFDVRRSVIQSTAAIKAREPS